MPDGFGGQTPLFGCVVSQAYLCRLQQDAAFARLLLDHGADPNAARHCASGCALSRTSPCTNTATSHRSAWGEHFTAPDPTGTHG